MKRIESILKGEFSVNFNQNQDFVNKTFEKISFTALDGQSFRGKKSCRGTKKNINT
jgi:hypothetical protein